MILTDMEMWGCSHPLPSLPLGGGIKVGVRSVPNPGTLAAVVPSLYRQGLPATRGAHQGRGCWTRAAVSYLTIEHKGEIEPDLARSVGGWAFVDTTSARRSAPTTRRVRSRTEPEFQARRPVGSNLPLDAVEGLSEGRSGKRNGRASLAQAGPQADAAPGDCREEYCR